MSGGSHNYIYSHIQEDLCGQMKDAELNDMMEDIKKLAHDLEWSDSADISHERYFKTVDEFKKKWFGTSREERLKSYIDRKIKQTTEELYRLIGV